MGVKKTKRSRSAVAALALLAFASALHLLALGDYDYYRDDVDYYRRQSQLQPNWMRRLMPALNPHSCSATPRPSCDGVLITSPGGVGSSRFIAALEHAAALGDDGAPFCVNDDRDFDGFKHLPAWAYSHNSTSLTRRANGRGRERRGTIVYPHEWGREVCFSKVMVIVGDPVHTIESTYRRFRMSHINKVRRAVGLLPYPSISGLSTLYKHIASSGKDQTGITNFVTSWYEASQDRSNWPEVRLVTARTLYDKAAEHARWIGVVEGSLRHFSLLHYDVWRQRGTGMSVDNESVRGKVLDVFGNVTEIVRLVEDPLPLVPIRRGPHRRRAAQKLYLHGYL